MNKFEDIWYTNSEINGKNRQDLRIYDIDVQIDETDKIAEMAETDETDKIDEIAEIDEIDKIDETDEID